MWWKQTIREMLHSTYVGVGGRELEEIPDRLDDHGFWFWCTLKYKF